ncbi:MAG: phosphoribosylformylglycinamidine synthase subunit PurL [Deltaproteobacteria bacterium]|nr:phosphoribosylformylglycinamidine synthase subunit PurL [Deltaproteobacteria bacterium]
MKITPELIAEHGLSKEEYQKVLEILGREPNINELGIFSVMWSEHCSYKSSKVHLKKFPTKAPWVIQGPGENAGVIDVGDDDAIVFKMESHNHPSFIEPYQGAATGVGGILRDVFTMGARPIANLNSLRFGEASHPKTAFLVGGVVAGIAGYGNCMGIPTVGGEVYFDACYNGNILVNAMTVGYCKKDKIYLGYASGVGNPVIYVGSKTGRDGIHGATMASDSFDEESEQKRPTVQVGDPFVEKLLLEACLELMQTDAIVGIQDMGAAGLTSSSFEMASRAGTGIEMNLDYIPQREENMTAYEMLLSESQERMLMVVQKGREDEVKQIFEKWDLDVAVVGEVTNTKRMVITHHKEVVVDVPIEPLAHAAPEYNRPQQEPAYFKSICQDVALPESKDLKQDALDILSSPTIASKRWVYRQYDHMVMTGTVQLPGGDAALVRVPDSDKAVAITTNCNSRYVYLDPVKGSQIAIAECGRNIVCTGAKPLAITDCLNFGNPENPEIMWQFAKSCEGLSEACDFFETPVVSGNVSLYNETNGESIFPTPTIGMVGLLKNVNQRLDTAFKNPGDAIFLFGETKAEFGGSEYLKLKTGSIQGRCPDLDLKTEKQLWDVLLDLNQKSLLQSAHDCSEGGVLVTLFESAFAKGMGFDLSTQSDLRAQEFLFSESQSRVVVSVSADNKAAFEQIVSQSGIPCLPLGKVTSNQVQWQFNGQVLFNESLESFQRAYQGGFEQKVLGN